MKIKTKIIGSFTLVSLIVAIAAYFSVIVTRQFFEKEIGSSSAVLVGETIHRLDRVIYKRIVEWQVRANTAIFQETIKKSNTEFDQMNNIEEYINEQDKKWTSVKEEDITPFMSELLNNSLSQSMKQVLDEYMQKYGYDVFSEVFITNKYGANIALTNKTTDYRQDDEEWWQKAKENNLYIGAIEYDESTKSYSMDLAIRVDDENGNFIGVIDAALNIGETREIINEVKDLEKERSLDFILLNKDGKIIHSTQDFTFLEQISPDVFSKINPTSLNHEGYFVSDSDLAAYAQSLGYNEYKGFGWTLLSIQKTAEAFAPVTSLRNIVFLITLIVLILSFLIAYFISRSVIKPINKMRDRMEIVAKGNLDYRPTPQAKDEMGELSIFFNKMIESLKRTNIEISNKVKEQTQVIEDKKQDMESQQSAILNVLEDVEQEKNKTEEEKDKINAILQGIGEGVFVIDNNLRIVLFNPASSKISGFLESEAVGKRYDKVLKFIYEKNGKTNDAFIEQPLKTGRIFNALNHTILIGKDEQKIPVSTSGAPLKGRDGNIIGCVAVFRDETKERNIDRTKTEFVSLASHQLRTPLTTINWYTEMLMSGDAGKMSGKQKNYLGEIYSGSKRMVKLVNALLNVSRIDMGTLAIEPEPVDIEKLSSNILEDFLPQINKKKLKIQKKYSKDIPAINLDPKLIAIIFQNLFSNAIKYTSKRGEILVEIFRKDKDAILKVSDNGYGIPLKQQEKIFEKLFRADNARETETDGTGLGLYITKAIVDNLGGKIWFESPSSVISSVPSSAKTAEEKEKIKGTTFYVSIPLKGVERKEGTKGILYTI